MNDIMKSTEIEYTKKNAKVEFINGNYIQAKTILENLWDNSCKDDAYLLYDYGKALRKANESITFIEICNELKDNKSIMSNKWIISISCWCSYDCYIKNYSETDKDGFSNFIKNAEYIKNNCVQMDANQHYITPYVFTIKKVIKTYNERPSRNFNEIIKWLSYLDPDRLSEDVYGFQDKNGKERELASSKEFYYQHMAKALEKTERYESCIFICETAFKQINKFHYRNNIWFKARLYYSQCMMQDDNENAFREYNDLAFKENNWSMYHKLSQICFRYNKVSESLLYASKAFLCRFEHEKMVNLMSDTALLWEATGNKENAKLFFQGSAYYRNQRGWSIPEELQYVISTFEINFIEKPNINLIQSISEGYVVTIEGKIERHVGRINNILIHGRSGFIIPTHGGSNVYFSINDVLDKRKLTKGDTVEYELSKGEDNKIRAIKIGIKGLK